MQIRRAKLLLHALDVFQPHPGRNEQVETGIGNFFDVLHPAVNAEDDIRFETDIAEQLLESAIVARPELVLIRDIRPDIHEQRIFLCLGHRLQILVDNRVHDPFVPTVVIALEARRRSEQDWFLRLLKFTDHLLNRIADNLRRAAAEHDEHVRVDDLQRVGNGRAQLLFTAEDDIALVDTRAGKDVR